MDRKGYQDLIHLTEAERAALSDRLRHQSRNGKSPKGERRREKRWDFSQAEIAACIEHPGGGISRFMVWSRDLSAGGMAFIHGGFLHVGSRCRIALAALDGKRVPIIGAVTACKLVEGCLHSISVRFDKRIDPRVFIADYVEPDPAPAPVAAAAPAEPVYTSLKDNDGDAEHVNKYISEANAAAKKLADSMTANDLVVVKDVCTKIKGSAKPSGFENMGTIADEALSMLDAGKTVTDVTAQLQQLCQLCARVTVRPKDEQTKKDDPPKKAH